MDRGFNLTQFLTQRTRLNESLYMLTLIRPGGKLLIKFHKGSFDTMMTSKGAVDKSNKVMFLTRNSKIVQDS